MFVTFVLQKQIDAIAARMTPETKEALERIYAPVVVTVPCNDARCGMCVMPDGEIRYYGYRNKKEQSDYTHPVYMASSDCGLNWTTHEANNDHTAAGTRLSNGKYLSVVAPQLNETGFSLRAHGITRGCYAVLYDEPGSETYELIKITDAGVYDMYLPLELSTGRIVVPAQTVIDTFHHPVILFSDDFGKTWQVRVLESAPRHTVVWPHKGLRWQNEAAEPTVTELSDGRLYLLARTSLDVYYEYYSNDGGDTWTTGAPASLHGTLTSPQLLKLSDGRLLCFFCNTQPLPELDHTKQVPALADGEISGIGGEDVFTNRDANHAAVSSDDGAHWTGLRELFLNGIRNNSDYRTVGGAEDSIDKSVHQFQAIELPLHKVLVCFGQNNIARKLVIFDVDWLYEKERHEDFRHGLQNVSTQVYLKSVAGNFRVAGHCSWNRTNGAVLMPDPRNNWEEALFLSRVNDPRLFSKTQGVVWNFPAAHKGEITVRLRVDGGPLHVSLCDRWFNPIDETVPHFALASFTLTHETLPANAFSEVKLTWDTAAKKAALYLGDTVIGESVLGEDFPHGASYLIIQSAYHGIDTRGAYIKELDMKSAITDDVRIKL